MATPRRRCVRRNCAKKGVWSTWYAATKPEMTARRAAPAPVTSDQYAAARMASRRGPVAATSNATEATSRATGKSLRAECHSARDKVFSLQSQLAHLGRVARVVVEPLAGFLPEHPGQHHALEQRGRGVLRFPVFVEH